MGPDIVLGSSLGLDTTMTPGSSTGHSATVAEELVTLFTMA